jgi:hypothetical protein
MVSRRARIVAAVAAVAVLSTTWAIADAIGGPEAEVATCTQLSGTAKANVSLSSTVPTAAKVNFNMTATGCDAPAVNAISTNGDATNAAVVGTLASPSAGCVLSSPGERPWGKLTIRWRNATGADIVDANERKVTDAIWVRMNPDGTERYDLTGFDAKGPIGGGDVSLELGLHRTNSCGTGKTSWLVVSDGTLAGTGEAIGSDGPSDDLRIERPRNMPTTTTTTPPPQQLSVSIAGVTGEYVDHARVTGPSIDCGSTCTATYLRGTSVGLHAVDDPTVSFVGWSDPSCGTQRECTVTMDQDLSVIAYFAPITEQTISVLVTGTADRIGPGDGFEIYGSGTVVSTPPGIDCHGGYVYAEPEPGPACSATFPTFTDVELRSIPDSGSVGGFTGACSDGGPATCTTVKVGVNANPSVEFRPNSFSVYVGCTWEPEGCGADISVSYPGGGLTWRAGPCDDIDIICSRFFRPPTATVATVTISNIAPGFEFVWWDLTHNACRTTVGNTCSFTVDGRAIADILIRPTT